MRGIQRRLFSIAVPITLALSATLAGCLGGGGGSDKNTTTDAATSRSEAASAIATALNTAARAIDGASDGITLRAMTANGLMRVPVSSRVQSKFDVGLKNTLAKARAKAARYTKRSVANHESTGTSPATTGDEIVHAAEIEEYLINPSVSGNTVTFQLNTALACEGEVGADLAKCTTALSKVTIVLTRDSSTAGTLDIRYDSSSLLKIGYAPGNVYFEVNFGTIKTLGDDVDGPQPGSASGALRLTVDVDNSTLGQEKASLTFGITEAIDIQNSIGGQIKLAVAEKAFGFAADNAADTATLFFGFGTIDLEDVYCALELDPCPTALTHDVAHFNALTGNFEFSTGKLVATNVGVGGEAYSDDNKDSTKENVLTMSTLGFTLLEGTPDTATFDTALELTATEPDSSLMFSAPAGTVLSFYYPITGDVTMVTSGGPFAVMGTGTKAGSLSATQGTCYIENSMPFPYEASNCP